LGVAVAAVLAGAITAVVMAAQPSSHPRGTLATAASYLGVSSAQLHRELRSGESLAQIADATPGKSASGLIHVLESTRETKLADAAANVPKRVAAEVNRRWLPRHGGVLGVSERYLGLSATRLRGELRAGKTLAQIAAATPGKSAAGLIEAFLSSRRSALDAEVSAGVLSQERADALLAKYKTRITARVQRTPGTHPAHAAPAGRPHRPPAASPSY
jgi:hypothetical protein